MDQAGNNSSKIILIVEDEEMLSQALHDALAAEGYTVLVAPNGEEGLKMALEKSPQLILLDVLMPKVDGITMLHQLREKQQAANKSRVIFFTNLSQAEKIADAIKEGAEGYMVKAESSLDDIVKKVHEFFAHT